MHLQLPVQFKICKFHPDKLFKNIYKIAFASSLLHSKIKFLQPKDAGDKLEDTVAQTEFEIITKPCLPQAAKIYRTPEAHRTEVEKQMNELLQQNVIRPSNSPWNAPVHVVSKKLDADGIRKWRVVIDYRLLNK